MHLCRHIEEAVNRPAGELDLERVQMPAVSDAGDVARDYRLTFDPGMRDFIRLRAGEADGETDANEENGGAKYFHRLLVLGICAGRSRNFYGSQAPLACSGTSCPRRVIQTATAWRVPA